MACVAIASRAGERVGQGGFPDAGRPEERDRPAWLAPVRQHRPTARRPRASSATTGTRSETVRAASIQDCRSVTRSALVRTITGVDLRLEGKRDIALQPRQVEIRIAGRDDEDGVDIRGDQLHLAVRARRTALDQALARQDAARPGPRAVEQQPVAHGRVGARRDCLVDAVAHDLQPAAMHGDDAHRGRRGQRLDVDLLRKKGPQPSVSSVEGRGSRQFWRPPGRKAE